MAMTRSEKKTVIENMAERFMEIGNFAVEGKTMMFMVLSAYMEGKAAGKAEASGVRGGENGTERK